VGSLVGVIYVLAAIGVVFYAIPGFWQALIGPALKNLLGSFVNVATVGTVMLAATAGLAYVGVRLVGPGPPRGLRAASGVGVIGVLLIALVTVWTGTLLESLLGAANTTLGVLLTAAIGIALLIAGTLGFCRPGFEKRLIQIEDQGWFTLAPYKRSQGQRVRRGTIVGILALVGSGIWTMSVMHRSLSGDWTL